MSLHNNNHDGVANLASKAFIPMHMCDDPQIYIGRAVRGWKENLKWSPSKDEGWMKGGLLIIGLWMQGVGHYSLHDCREYWRYLLPIQIIQEVPGNFWEVEEKNYLNACLKQCRHFTTVIVLVEIIIGVESEATLKRIASLLVTKCNEPYSWTYGYVKSRISITLVWASHRCIRGGRFPAYRSIVLHPQWENVSVLQLLN